MLKNILFKAPADTGSPILPSDMRSLIVKTCGLDIRKQKKKQLDKPQDEKKLQEKLQQFQVPWSLDQRLNAMEI